MRRGVGWKKRKAQGELGGGEEGGGGAVARSVVPQITRYEDLSDKARIEEEADRRIGGLNPKEKKGAGESKGERRRPIISTTPNNSRIITNNIEN